MFGELPSWGFYVRHVEGLTMKNVTLRLRDKDFRPALVFDDVHGLHLENMSLSKTNDMQSPLVMRNVSGETVGKVTVPTFKGELIQKVN